MPLTEWQGSLQSVTFGAGTNYRFSRRAASSPPSTEDCDLRRIAINLLASVRCRSTRDGLR